MTDNDKMHSGKKVLMLVHTFPPFGSVGGSIRLVKFLRFLNQGESEWQPVVITLDPDIDLLWLPKQSSFSLDELPDDVRLMRIGTGEPINPRIEFQPLYKLVRKIKLALLHPWRKYFLIPDDKAPWRKSLESAALEELASQDYSLIYATAPPFSVLLAAERLKAATGLPLVMDIKDDWLIEPRFRGLKRYRKGLEASMEARCIAAADRVITVTPNSYDAYRARYPEEEDKFELIHNGCDMEEYKPYWSDRPEKFNKFTLIHTGVFSSRRDMSALFRALKRLTVERPGASDNAQFLVVGSVPGDQQKAIVELELQGVVKATGYMERERFIETLVKAHLPVVVNYSVPTLIPGKLYEYWGSRNPMLLLDNDDSAAADLVGTYDLGQVVAVGDEEGIFQFILQEYDAWVRGESRLIDVSGLQQFDRQVLTRKLESVFSSLVDKT